MSAHQGLHESLRVGFGGTGQPLTRDGLAAACDLLGVDAPTLWAVMQVETHGSGFLRDGRPVILFERHVFSRATSGQWDRGHPELSSSRPGGYFGGAREYRRLHDAAALDLESAVSACSWGLPQLMGFNFRAGGFATLAAMVAACMESEDAQVLAMARFIDRDNLGAALHQRDWSRFARAYNGPAYARNQYDTRLAARWAALVSGGVPDLDVRAGQMALARRGFEPGPIDGLLGRRTRSALAVAGYTEALIDASPVELLREVASEIWPSLAPMPVTAARDQGAESAADAPELIEIDTVFGPGDSAYIVPKDGGTLRVDVGALGSLAVRWVPDALFGIDEDDDAVARVGGGA